MKRKFALSKRSKPTVRVTADIDASLAQQIDEERMAMGRIGRSAMIRIALVERYRNAQHTSAEDHGA